MLFCVRSKQGNGALENYCINLNEKAKAGRIDPLIGREAEVERTSGAAPSGSAPATLQAATERAGGSTPNPKRRKRSP